jgi:hypothetical protein
MHYKMKHAYCADISFLGFFCQIKLNMNGSISKLNSDYPYISFRSSMNVMSEKDIHCKVFQNGICMCVYSRA